MSLVFFLNWPARSLWILLKRRPNLLRFVRVKRPGRNSDSEEFETPVKELDCKSREVTAEISVFTSFSRSDRSAHTHFPWLEEVTHPMTLQWGDQNDNP